MTALQTAAASDRIRPYPQRALGGELGLTSADIAHAIGVQHRHLIQDLKGRQYVSFLRSAGFQFAEFSANREGAGRKGKMFVFDVEASKAIVAMSRTKAGAGYLRYLISIEGERDAVVAELAATRIENASLHAKLEALTSPKPRRIPGKGLVSVIVRTLQVVDMFGLVHEEIRREKKLYDELSEGERRAYRIQHRSAVLRGLAALQDDDINPRRRDDDETIH